ncbi:MAG: prepilin peptidase [Clostridiales bacterium]|nr:prepilin peptidase [Clostridiales bacterium]
MLYYGPLLIILILISISDIKTMKIPDKYIIAGSFWAILLNVLGRGIGISKGLLGALIGGITIIIISYISFLIFKKPGMGGGDVKLLAMAGLFIGWELALLSLLLAIYIAGSISIILMVIGKIKRDDYIPFGPYIAIGITLSVLIGRHIIEWYMYIFGS